MYIVLIIAAIFILSSNVWIYNVLFNINAGLLIVVIIVLESLFPNLNDKSDILLMFYVISALLLLITLNTILEYIQKIQGKSLLVKRKFICRK